MTGFASVSREESGERVSVTVKSVNHRFLDAVVKAPSSLGALEASIKALVQDRVTRGRVEFSVSAETTTAPPREVVLDEALLDRVAQALESARARGFVAGALSASDILRIPGVLEIRPKAADPAGLPDTMSRLVLTVAGDALEALVAMR